MPLSDYSTSAEKIAALKAATLDPALMNMEIGTLNVSEDIYLVTCNIYLNSMRVPYSFSTHSYIMPKLSSGDVITQGSASTAFMYIKDSDIVYSDPVTTYQDRLAKISEADMKIVDNTGFTTGADGCMILTISGSATLRVDGKSLVSFGSDTAGRPLNLPMQSGWVISSISSVDEIIYIDLPSDW